MGTIAQPPGILTAYDTVGSYDQDAINGFSEQTLTSMLDIVDPAHTSRIMDAMAGNGNLTVRLYNYCTQRGIAPPDVTVLEFSRVQCDLGKKHLAHTPAQVIWGNVLTMEDYDKNEFIPANTFDAVMIKSGNHEIPLDQQLKIYKSVFHVLKPGGLFINLGFLFDDAGERDEFREVSRSKDSLAGMQSAAENRHFLTRDEFYGRLQEAEFRDILCAAHVPYVIRLSIAIQAYFLPSEQDRASADI